MDEIIAIVNRAQEMRSREQRDAAIIARLTILADQRDDAQAEAAAAREDARRMRRTVDCLLAAGITGLIIACWIAATVIARAV